MEKSNNHSASNYPFKTTLTPDDQEWINNNVSTDEIEAHAYVNGNGDDTYKQQVNFELTQDKRNAIAKLKNFHYRTPPVEIANLLEIIFEGSNTNPGWWLVVAQRWNPRAIHRVINQMAKTQSSGWTIIKNPGAYFTSRIKYRKKRRNITKLSINDTNKQP